MKTNKIFCEECRDDVFYEIKKHQMEATLKGTVYFYNGETARCNQCGIEVYVPEIEDNNLKLLYDQYRINNNIISLEKIRQIPLKYKIGKRPLSLLLGWGELTFTRYFDGDIPTRQYSDILEKIYNDPLFYLQVLDEKKDDFKSLIPYKKSRLATLDLIKKNRGHESKIQYAAAYILYTCKDITPFALQKILYYIQGFSFIFTNKFIFEEDCEAWLQGPVFPEVYKIYSTYNNRSLNVQESLPINLYTPIEIETVENVVRYFGCFSGKIFEEFTHSELPWISIRSGTELNTPSTKIIPKELIGDFFTSIRLQNELSAPTDICKYANQLFYQNHFLCQK